MKKCKLISVLLFTSISLIYSGSRTERDLSGKGWKLIQDKDQTWKQDSFYLPPVDIEKLPVHIPTGGWEVLNSSLAKEVSVPGTTEEYLQKNSGPDSNMIGVSWWYRTIQIPNSANHQRIILRFESARYRSEVFINQKLAGYDLIGNTPFDVDVTHFVKPGEMAQLAVRITNPGGNFDWRDRNNKWGDRIVAGSLGFGGITGRVKLVACNPVYIDDIYMQNTPVYTTVNAIITVINTSGKDVLRDITFRVSERKNATNEIFRKLLKSIRLKPGENVISERISAPDAKLWDINSPNLYSCNITINENGKESDSDQKNFGFRWFELSGIGSDAMFRLNGKRIVLRTAISWGFWPVSGMVPTPELAEKQIRIAKQLGLNMLNFHRAIGQPMVLELADELGLLYYEEPGNYGESTKNEFAHSMEHEKLMRMVRRDRSHPSLVIYNMQNEARDVKPPIWAMYKNDMRDAHNIDPSRTYTRTSGFATSIGIDDQYKLHMRPFDSIQYMQGWFDCHHAGGPHTWMQSFYKSPTNYFNFTTNKAEIVYWGEEGAISAPDRVEKMKVSLDKASNPGWDGEMYKSEYSDFQKYFNSKKLSHYFSSLDTFTMAMGDISYEHQGRKIENARINNITDGYAINGWESEIIENHSGIVDCYRNPKGDPSILAYYNQPLYIAVKTRKQVSDIKSSIGTDFYIINEKNINGVYELQIKATDASGKEILSKCLPVNISGGDIYGELIAENIPISTSTLPGMVTIEGQLTNKKGDIIAKGHDKILAVDWKSQKLTGRGAVWEQYNVVRSFLTNQAKTNVATYSEKLPKVDWIIAARSPKNGEPGFIPTEQLIDLKGKSGITTTYFVGANFEKQVVQQTNPNLNFSVKEGAMPHSKVGTTSNYCVRWEGQIIPPLTGTYKFDLEYNAGDEIQMVIDGQKTVSINKTHRELTLNLIAGKPVQLLIELHHKRGAALSLLKWTIPESELYNPQDIIDRVKKDGTTLIILTNASSWMDIITKNTSVKYNGQFTVGTYWLGGDHFVVNHPLFKDLPINQGMNWAYEAVVKNGSERSGLKMEGEELVAGVYHSYPLQLGTAVGVIPCGKGKIVFSTLEIYNNLNNTESTAEVARKLLCNYIQFAAIGK